MEITCDNDYNCQDDKKDKAILKKAVMGYLPYYISKFIIKL